MADQAIDNVKQCVARTFKEYGLEPGNFKELSRLLQDVQIAKIVSLATSMGNEASRASAIAEGDLHLRATLATVLGICRFCEDQACAAGVAPTASLNAALKHLPMALGC